MSHLTREALARIVDEPASALESKHLEGCAACTDELAELRRLTAALGELPPLPPRPAAWSALEARLEREGLIRRRRPVRSRRSTVLGVAAACALLLLGGVLGATLQMRLAGPGATPLAENGYTGAAQDPALALQRAEVAYTDALARYTELSEGDDGDPYARLAALEGIVLTTRAALDEAPADPVINGYHLTALAQRDATLRRLVSGTGDPWF